MSKKLKSTKITKECKDSSTTAMSEMERGANIIFWVAFIISIGLIVGGFLVPPMGVIDGSVLTATGILSTFVELHHFIAKGTHIKNFNRNIEEDK